MSLLRGAMKVIRLSPILLLAASAAPGEASHPPVDLVVSVGLAPTDGSGPRQGLIGVQGSFSNHFCSGAPRDW